MADRKGPPSGPGRDKLRPKRTSEHGFSDEAKRPKEGTSEKGPARGVPGAGRAKAGKFGKKGPKPRSASLPLGGPGYNEAMDALPRPLAQELTIELGRAGRAEQPPHVEGRRRPPIEQPAGTTRLFAAAPLPLTLKRDLVFYQTSLLLNPRQLKIVKPENFHVTLHFLGNTTDAQMEAFKARMAEVAASQTPFRIEIGGVSAFPGAIIIPVVSGRIELVAMGMALRNVAAEVGLKTESKPINPHVTIARVRDRDVNPLELVDAENAEESYGWTCQSIALYESRLLPEGPEYIELARYPLAPTA